jgi:hypothetical protein
VEQNLRVPCAERFLANIHYVKNSANQVLTFPTFLQVFEKSKNDIFWKEVLFLQSYFEPKYFLNISEIKFTLKKS